jgi:tetratricopeptide (TPR) repeat protein
MIVTNMIKIYGTDSRVRMGMENGVVSIFKGLIDDLSAGPEYVTTTRLVSKGLGNVAVFAVKSRENGYNTNKYLEKFMKIYQNLNLTITPMDGNFYDFVKGLADGFKNDGKYLTAIEIYNKLIDGKLNVAECSEKAAERKYVGNLNGPTFHLTKAAGIYESIAKAREHAGQDATAKILFEKAAKCYEKIGDLQKASDLFGLAGKFAKSLELGDAADKPSKTNIFDPKTVEIFTLPKSLEIEASGIDKETKKPENKGPRFRKVE